MKIKKITAILAATVTAFGMSAQAADVTGGIITLGQFMGLTESGVYVNIDGAVLPTCLYADFYNDMNALKMQSRLSITDSQTGGIFTRTGDKRVYLSTDGDADYYAPYMSRRPISMYKSVDGAAYATLKGYADEAVNAAGTETVSEWAYPFIVEGRADGMTVEPGDYTAAITRGAFAAYISAEADTPDELLTRGGAAKMIAAKLGNPTGDDIEDVKAAGIMRGDESGAFAADEYMTIEEAVTAAVRWHNLAKK